MSASLDLYLAGTHLGRIDRSLGRITMTYDASYLALRHPTLLSLTMPPGSAPYPAHVVEPWLANLLSDPRRVEHTSKLAMSFGKSYDVRSWDTFRLNRAAQESGFDLDTIAQEIARQSDLLDAAMTTAMDEAEAAVPDLDLGPMREGWAARAQQLTIYRPEVG